MWKPWMMTGLKRSLSRFLWKNSMGFLAGYRTNYDNIIFENFLHYYRSEMVEDSTGSESTEISNSFFRNKTDENSILRVFPKPPAKHVEKLSIPPMIPFQTSKNSNGRPKRRPSLYNLHDPSSEVKKVRMESLESSWEHVASSHNTIGLPRDYFPSDKSSLRSKMRPRRFPHRYGATFLPRTTQDGQSNEVPTPVKRIERNDR